MFKETQAILDEALKDFNVALKEVKDVGNDDILIFKMKVSKGKVDIFSIGWEKAGEEAF